LLAGAKFFFSRKCTDLCDGPPSSFSVVTGVVSPVIKQLEPGVEAMCTSAAHVCLQGMHNNSITVFIFKAFVCSNHVSLCCQWLMIQFVAVRKKHGLCVSSTYSPSVSGILRRLWGGVQC
jgi:uncharacterized membrane protein